MKPNPKRPKKPVKADPKKKEKPKASGPCKRILRAKGEPLRNATHEAFAQAYFKGGKSIVDCYREVTGRNTSSDRELASRMLTQVDERVRELQQATAQGNVMDMTERREFFARVKRAKLRTFDSAVDGDLIQEITETSTAAGFTRKIKLPGKRECIMDDAKLAGDLVEKVEHSGEVTHVVLTEERRAQLVEKKRLAIERAKGALEA